jgi:hypothetical protein
MQLVPKQHVLTFSILLFLSLFYIVSFVIRPNFLYNDDGSIKPFGLGFKNKTIIPFWLLSIAIAVLSYLIMFYYSMINIVF